eukprot:GFYU01002215.1.p1 GENE.GFYU01002215.1~~GFYU01002215.1.p1  ORF type:complete len:811 (-),score=116.44 GFYU01002215.1:182-2614(-)
MTTNLPPALPRSLRAQIPATLYPDFEHTPGDGPDFAPTQDDCRLHRASVDTFTGTVGGNTDDELLRESTFTDDISLSSAGCSEGSGLAFKRYGSTSQGRLSAARCDLLLLNSDRLDSGQTAERESRKDSDLTSTATTITARMSGGIDEIGGRSDEDVTMQGAVETTRSTHLRRASKGRVRMSNAETVFTFDEDSTMLMPSTSAEDMSTEDHTLGRGDLDDRSFESLAQDAEDQDQSFEDAGSDASGTNDDFVVKPSRASNTQARLSNLRTSLLFFEADDDDESDGSNDPTTLMATDDPYDDNPTSARGRGSSLSVKDVPEQKADKQKRLSKLRTSILFGDDVDMNDDGDIGSGEIVMDAAYTSTFEPFDMSPSKPHSGHGGRVDQLLRDNEEGDSAYDTDGDRDGVFRSGSPSSPVPVRRLSLPNTGRLPEPLERSGSPRLAFSGSAANEDDRGAYLAPPESARSALFDFGNSLSPRPDGYSPRALGPSGTPRGDWRPESPRLTMDRAMSPRLGVTLTSNINPGGAFEEPASPRSQVQSPRLGTPRGECLQDGGLGRPGTPQQVLGNAMNERPASPRLSPLDPGMERNRRRRASVLSDEHLPGVGGPSLQDSSPSPGVTMPPPLATGDCLLKKSMGPVGLTIPSPRRRSLSPISGMAPPMPAPDGLQLGGTTTVMDVFDADDNDVSIGFALPPRSRGVNPMFRPVGGAAGQPHTTVLSQVKALVTDASGESHQELMVMMNSQLCSLKLALSSRTAIEKWFIEKLDKIETDLFQHVMRFLPANDLEAVVQVARKEITAEYTSYFKQQVSQM